MPTEFQFIDWLKQQTISNSDSVIAGIGDDCAILQPPAGHQLLVSTDTLVEGVHFVKATSAVSIGHKALAVSLSDLAAMGAEPLWVMLNLTLPAMDNSWLQDFISGFMRLAKQHNVILVGGDTTKGPLSITVTAQGVVPRGQAIRRCGAQTDDHIFVSGPLGEAAWVLKQNIVDDKQRLALDKPEPQLALGIALRNIASAAIDISDGLTADLQHILTASSLNQALGAELNLAHIPLGKQLQQFANNTSHQTALPYALSGGDDYQLCFTVPVEHLTILENLRKNFTDITLIGVVNTSGKLTGQAFNLKANGYQHF